MSGKEGDGFLDGDNSDGGESDTSDNRNEHQGAENADDKSFDGHRRGGSEGRQEDDKEYFHLPASLSTARHFKGITKNKKNGEVEITVRLPARLAERRQMSQPKYS